MPTDHTPLLGSRQPQNYLPEQIVYGIGAIGSLGSLGYQWFSSDAEWKTTLATVGVFATSCFGFIRACQHKNNEASASSSDLQGVVTVPPLSSQTTQTNITALEAELTECKSTIAEQKEEISRLSSRIQTLTVQQGTPSSVVNNEKPTQTLYQLVNNDDTDSQPGSAPSSPVLIARALPFTEQSTK